MVFLLCRAWRCVADSQVVLQRADGSMEWQKGDSFEMILGPLMGHHVTPAMADVHFEG
jgi:hypothetical protein